MPSATHSPNDPAAEAELRAPSAYAVAMKLAAFNRMEADGKSPDLQAMIAQLVRMVEAPSETPLDAFALVSAAHGLMACIRSQNDLTEIVCALLARAVTALEQATGVPNEHFLGHRPTAH